MTTWCPSRKLIQSKVLFQLWSEKWSSFLWIRNLSKDLNSLLAKKSSRREFLSKWIQHTFTNI